MSELTYELKIVVKDPSLKEQVIEFLTFSCGVQSFMEGFVDGLDLDYEYGLDDSKYFEELGGNSAPLSVFKYDLESLQSIQMQIDSTFDPKSVQTEITSIPTKSWQEEWKKSFKPITSKMFVVFPPWERSFLQEFTGLIPLEIEPAMAFGTGQHATTKLCLLAMEKYLGENKKVESLLDLGCGTGILALAASKLGVPRVIGTDTDPDAVLAFQRNIQANDCHLITSELGSFPSSGETFDVVFANILYSVLVNLIPEIVKHMKPQSDIFLSGLLESQTKDMSQRCEEFGLRLVESSNLDGWVCLQYRFV